MTDLICNVKGNGCNNKKKEIENKVLIATVKKKENRNKLIFKTKGNYLLAACA